MICLQYGPESTLVARLIELLIEEKRVLRSQFILPNIILSGNGRVPQIPV